jgi:SPP1 family phage portal protein
LIYISKETELNELLLQKVINRFTTTIQPQRQRWKNYYDGKHAILNKSYSEPSKPCSRIVTNYCKIVADTYNGYIVGKPVTYTSNNNIDEVQAVLNYNDTVNADMAFLHNALVYGAAYELHWLDAAAQERYSQVNPLNAFAIHDNTLDNELLYFVRWYKVDSFDDNDLTRVEVYDAWSVKYYESNGVNGALQLIEVKPHFFGDVPVSVFYLNDEESIFNCIMDLNDAYNELQSSEVDDFSAWVDAYLTLTGCDLDEGDAAKMKENRLLLLPEGATANWLVKNASDTQIVNMLENIKKNIFKVSACPDMADDNFLAQSGTALAYKLVGFENVASTIVAAFTKALQRRIELICNVLNLKATEAVWRDININFVRNLPVNTAEVIQLVNSLQGVVSDATLLAQIPFIKDVQAELEAVQKQKADNMALYDFGAHDHDEAAVEDETDEE